MVAKKMEIKFECDADVSHADYQLAEKLASYSDAQITENDPAEWHIATVFVHKDSIAIVCFDGVMLKYTKEQAIGYIMDVDRARANNTGDYY